MILKGKEKKNRFHLDVLACLAIECRSLESEEKSGHEKDLGVSV